MSLPDRTPSEAVSRPPLSGLDSATVGVHERGWVYFIRAGDSGPIKIGYSTRPDERLGDLQTASPFSLVMLGKVPGSTAREAELHRLFAPKRLSGEWFDLQASDIAPYLRPDVPLIVQFGNDDDEEWVDDALETIVAAHVVVALSDGLSNGAIHGPQQVSALRELRDALRDAVDLRRPVIVRFPKWVHECVAEKKAVANDAAARQWLRAIMDRDGVAGH